MSDMQALLEARSTRLADAFAHRIPDRVPMVFMVETWAGHYAGGNIIDVGFDHAKLRDDVCKVVADFPEFDAMPPAFGIRPGNLYAATASREFSYFDAAGKPYASVQHSEAGNILLDEEYPEWTVPGFVDSENGW